MPSTVDNPNDRHQQGLGAAAHDKNKASVPLSQQLMQLQQALLASNNEAELFPRVCQLAAEHAGVSMAWIGLADQQSERIAPVASFGADAEQLQKFCLATRYKSAQDLEPVATAFRSNQPVITNDWTKDSQSAAVLTSIQSSPWGSSASFPIQRNDQPYAVLSVYYQVKGFFSSETIEFFVKLCQDSCLCLDNIQQA